MTQFRYFMDALIVKRLRLPRSRMKRLTLAILGILIIYKIVSAVKQKLSN